MKCQSLFSRKNIISLLSAEYAQRVVKVKRIALGKVPFSTNTIKCLYLFYLSMETYIMDTN